MSFISLLFALLLDQVRPMANRQPLHQALYSWVGWVTNNLDAGKPRQAWVVWWVALGVPVVLGVLIYWLVHLSLGWFGWVAAIAWNIAVLHVTLGFRQFSHHFTLIRDELESGNEDEARRHLADWMQVDTSTLPKAELVSRVIEHSVLSAHRHVFGVFAWFSLFAAFGLGPAGAIVYWMGNAIARVANTASASGSSLLISEGFTQNAALAWKLIDWLPSRITALGFAFVGSFEDAVDNWRQYETSKPAGQSSNDEIILCATAGAVGVQLQAVANIGSGVPPKPAHLRAVVGLVWRTVVMWMVLVALLTFARLIG